MSPNKREITEYKIRYDRETNKIKKGKLYSAIF